MSSKLVRRRVGASIYISSESDEHAFDTAVYKYYEKKKSQSKHEEWVREALRAQFRRDMKSIAAAESAGVMRAEMCE